jgi:hypothetical protein
MRRSSACAMGTLGAGKAALRGLAVTLGLERPGTIRALPGQARAVFPADEPAPGSQSRRRRTAIKAAEAGAPS